MNVNFNVEITEQTEPKAVISKLKEIREGLKLSGILAEEGNPRRIKVNSEERELRKEWTKLTGKPRYKVSDLDKLLIEQKKTTIEEVLKSAIENWKSEHSESLINTKTKLLNKTTTSREKKFSHY